MLFLFVAVSLSANTPTTTFPTCTTGQFLSWYSFECKACPAGTTSNAPGKCECAADTPYLDVKAGQCKSQCDVIRNGFCYTRQAWNDESALVGTLQSSFNVYNWNNKGETRSIEWNSTAASQEMIDAAISCRLSADPTTGFRYDMVSCEKVANLWTMSYYKSENFFTRSMSFDGNTFAHEMTWWPANQPFITFNRGYSFVMESQYVTSTFNYASILTFQLARYFLNGTFAGLKTLRIDTNQCGEPNDIAQLWRQWGTNFYSSCNFNLGNAIAGEEYPYMYDLFLEDGPEKVLRPIPIVVRNYVDGTTQNLVNQGDSTARWLLSRRFFMTNNQSNYLRVVQYATNITLEIQISPTSQNRILPPLLFITYAEQDPNTAKADPQNINYGTTSLTVPAFQFNVLYTRDMSQFWRSGIIVLIVFLVLGFIIWLFRSVIYARDHKNDGTVILSFIAFFCTTFGIALTLIVFIMSFFFLFIFYKWQKTGFISLPPESEFWFLSIFVWLAFGLAFIGTIIQIFMQSSQTIFLIDWDNPHKEGVPVSAWRRLMVANCWNKLTSIRSYSIEFTLLVLLFLLEGFDLQLLAAPIPRTELVDVGKTYKILRFAFVVFLWIILMIVEYFLNILVWIALGNPFLNFIDLCAVSNISVLILDTPTSGYYIHGRSVHAHADENMVQLNENLCAESNGMIGKRGLVENTDNQVFKMYLSTDFSYNLGQAFKGVLERFGRRALSSGKAQNSKARMEVEAMGAYDSLNRFLRKFFESSEGAPKYIVQQSTISENVIGWSPQVNDTSILTIQGDHSYRRTLLIGFEWTISVTALLLFAGIDMETESPAIAAFVVYFVDMIVCALFRKVCRRTLCKKAVLDSHFIIH